MYKSTDVTKIWYNYHPEKQVELYDGLMYTLYIGYLRLKAITNVCIKSARLFNKAVLNSSI